MRFKIWIAIFSIYVAAFSRAFFELLDLGQSIDTIILLGIDIGVFYLGVSTILERKFNLYFLILVVIMSLLNFFAHEYSFLTYLNGLREVLLVVLLFSFYESLISTRYRRLFERKMQRFIDVFLVAQIPLSLYQFFLFGASDHVGGTLGEGNSGVLTLLTIPMVYLKIKNGRVKHGAVAYLYSIFLIPLFLNETKVSFILIPIMFLCLADIRKMGTVLASSLGGLLLFMALNGLYTDQGSSRDNPFEEMFSVEYLERYLFSEAEQGTDIPRFTKILIANQILLGGTEDFLLGKEVGAFKGGTTISASAFAVKYKWLLGGSRPYVFFLLITGGWLLLSFMLYYFARKIIWDKADNSSLQFTALLGSIFIIILFYNDILRSSFFCYLFLYFIFCAKGWFGDVELRKRIGSGI